MKLSELLTIKIKNIEAEILRLSGMSINAQEMVRLLQQQEIDPEIDLEKNKIEEAKY